MARGKYAHVIDKLPRLLGEAPEYQQKVDAVKTAIQAQGPMAWTAVNLATEYEHLRAEKDALEAQLSDINLQLEAHTQLLSERFDIEGVTSLRLANGKSVTVQYEPSAKVENREQFRQWCLTNELAESLTLPWQTLNAITKERLLAGLPEPDGVKAYTRTKIVLRKG